MKTPSFVRLASFGFTFLVPALVLAQGPLSPPPAGSLPLTDEALDGSGAPKISMKTLTQTDPGQPIPSRDPAFAALNGSAGAYHITVPGHYFLTENLVGDKPVIIESDGVTLDLRGFEIRFVPSGAGAPPVAITSLAGPTTYDRIVVKNGHITGGWTEGVHLGSHSSVKDLEVSGPLTYGIYVENNGLVEDAQVRGPNSTPVGPGPHSGISTGGCSIVTGSTVQGVHGIGIRVDSGSTVVDSAACENLGCGIVGLKGNTVRNSTAHRNGNTGIDFYSAATIDTCAATENAAEGVKVRAGSTVQNTVSNSNLLEGFLAEPANVGQPNEYHTAVNFLQCSAAQNKRDGFRSGINTLFTHCTADQNGDGQGPQPQPGFPPAMAGPDGDGFDIHEGSKVNACVATNNSRHGIRGGNYNFITDCTVHANGGWGIDILTNENVVMRNYVRGNGAGAISAAGGSVGPFILPSASTNPNGNYSF